MPEGTVNVRYMVHDVGAAVEFDTKHFGFTVGTHGASAFADVFRGKLRLLLSGPSNSAGRPMPDGAKPGPGGWNRVEFVVNDIEAEVERLRAEGVPFRSDIITGPGGKQIPPRGSFRKPGRAVQPGQANDACGRKPTTTRSRCRSCRREQARVRIALVEVRETRARRPRAGSHHLAAHEAINEVLVEESRRP